MQMLFLISDGMNLPRQRVPPWEYLSSCRRLPAKKSPRRKSKQSLTVTSLICGLHILLDYFIDQEEDQREDDLNFISFYPGKEQCLDRMEKFVKKALDQAGKMPDPVFHRTLVKGLLALYLSDPKILSQGLYKSACRLLAATGEKDAYLMFYACRCCERESLSSFLNLR